MAPPVRHLAPSPGTRFGSLVVVGVPVGRSVPCLCDCGSPERLVGIGALLREGRPTLSCGCRRRSGRAAHWVWTPEACRKAAEQLPGTVVTYNYDAMRPLGRVVSAEADEVGVYVTMELTELPPGVRMDEVGPGFSTQALSLDAQQGERVGPVHVRDLRVREVALLPPDPLEVRTFDGRWRDWVVIVVVAVALLAFWAGVGYLAGAFG